jgi:acyl-coenzyme A synthetase/AMP-(fatty) acid ligase
VQLTDQITNTCNICNISDYLRLNSEKFPDKPALLYPEKISYRELEDEVNRNAFGLNHSGIKAGTLTVLMLPAGSKFFVLTFALLRIGAIPVLIDPGMGIRKMAKALANLKPDAFIAILKAHILRLIYPKIFKNVKSSIIVGFTQFNEKRRVNNLLKKQTPQYSSHIAATDEPAAIFFTSGSTGQAKGVIYTTGMLKNQVQVTKTLFNIGSDDIDLCTFPLLGLFAICHGNSSVIADINMQKPATLNPAKVISNIQDYSCTQMFGSPMVLNKLSQYGSVKGIKIYSLRKIISAGAPVHSEILESFRKMISSEARIHTTFGATEALPLTDITAGEILRFDHKGNVNGICVGYPIEGVEVKIIEITDKQISEWDKTNQLSVNEIGEIVVKGPWVSASYFNNENANELSKIIDLKTGELWHRMGDLGRFDQKGRLWFYGRKSQRVITTDRTLFTIPCEAVFNQHSLVARSALVGIPLNGSGISRPVICIELKSGFHQTKDLKQELYKYGKSSMLTNEISDILFFKKFPVDPRHNAKIFREKLAVWATKRIR